MLALRKPNILIPLSAAASRGDQILNARSFEKQGFSVVIEEENLTNKSLIDAIDEVYMHKDKYVGAMKNSSQTDAIKTISELIKMVSK